jgi:hypothetical protein
MATKIVSTDIAGNVKPSFASSTLVGLTVRANGEEATKVLDMNGNMVDAQFPTPTAAPTLSLNGGTDLVDVANKWAAYEYVWAATERYPLVENDIAIGGSVAPRGMPSPKATIQVDAAGQKIHLLVAVPPVDRPDLNQIWIFRTAFFDTQTDADLNAEAGNLFFLTALDVPTIDYDDINPLEGTDEIELDNFGVPTFRYVTYIDPYWWGWGNYPLSIDGTWATNGAITLTDSTKWFPGRNGQYVRLEGVDTGGIGDNGLWLFKWVTATTAQLINLDETDGTVPTSGTGKIVIQGPPSTLFRSKPRNPFSWGFTEFLADGSRIPQVYAFKIGGGLGTAISPVPTVPYLLICTEFPAGTFTLDLRAAGTTSFENTLRKISNFYSITSHFSIFTATRQFFPVSGSEQREEKIVLWGWDAKNFCIIETDGIGLSIVSEKISKTLRHMTQDRSRQLLAHGAYDARNRMNCMWLPDEDSDSQVNLLVMHHAPTDQWFLQDEKDVLCSAQFQDGDTNLSKIYVGTETGLLGEAFADGFYSNWISSARSFGTIGSATTNSITRNDSLQFFLDRNGYVGNWCLITDANGENEQWGRISAVTVDTLTFDYIQPVVGSNHGAFNPAVTLNSIFMVGVIECRALKYFDGGSPTEDRAIREIWLTIDNVDVSFSPGHTGSTFLRYYRERTATPFAPKADGRLNIPLFQINQDDATGEPIDPTQVWGTQTPPTERQKCFGIEIIDRGFIPWRLYNWAMKIE